VCSGTADFSLDLYPWAHHPALEKTAMSPTRPFLSLRPRSTPPQGCEPLALVSEDRRVFEWRQTPGQVGKSGPSQTELTYLSLAREWGQSIEFGNRYSAGHCLRVAQNAVSMAQALGLDETSQTLVRVGAYLHNVGRVRVPRDIQGKVGPLTREEFGIVEMVPVWGTEILANTQLPWNVKPIVRWLNEKYDGSGYPDRLRGDDIPVVAQIVGIANVYDALTSSRPYRAALTPRQALLELSNCRSWWSREIFEACVPRIGGVYSGSLRLA
jgi:HD-GYP domain-containing protein (c-di-GMP phosphodiesterase class II)